jgi:hypothetical protein
MVARELRSPGEAQKEIESIQAELNEKGEKALLDLQPLTVNDCVVVGLVVQTFAYADLNARRAIEIIDFLEGKPIPAANKTLRDNEVLPVLRERSTALPISNDERVELLTAITMMEQFIRIRHLFAHWAARRHPTKDALIVMTTNAREASRRAGHGPERFKASNAIVPMPEVRANLPILEKNADYIAAKVRDWWLRFMPPEMQ